MSQNGVSAHINIFQKKHGPEPLYKLAQRIYFTEKLTPEPTNLGKQINFGPKIYSKKLE